ncbi:unnamed protein product [Caenorhabditis auriculariae]|uniref:Uncharacterized protein n=1 Tax=Caenorhabditis auriculariae TaxID=2777116 RepID=A0A8S1HDQ9_9PELO|nr:unnamed protein product [Caenorhabditis auriculariae]
MIEFSLFFDFPTTSGFTERNATVYHSGRLRNPKALFISLMHRHGLLLATSLPKDLWQMSLKSASESSDDFYANPYKGVIFDYGEVLWMQSRNIHVYRQIEGDNGLFDNSLVPTLLSKELAEVLPKNFHEDLLTGVYTAKDFDQYFVAAYNRKYDTKLKNLKFFSATEYDKEAAYEVAVLHACCKLRKRGIKTILMLDTYHVDETRTGRKIPNMDIYFDHVVESCNEGLKKPDPRFYMAVLEKADLQSDEVIYIDDSKINCETAEMLGMRFIQAYNSMDMLEDLQEILGFELD